MLGLDDVDIPQIKLRPIDQLVPYANNARTHSAAQTEELLRLLQEFGWTNAVLIDEKGIVAGHGRCMAASLGYERGMQFRFPNGSLIPVGMVPTLDCTGWSNEQRRAYIIADNRSALSAGWDEELLRVELLDLLDAEYDLTLTAFSDEELAELTAPLVDEPPAADPDAIPPEREQPASVPGDVWVCGPHRIVCGDAAEPETWRRLMQGELADVCFTDPPFNVDLGLKNKRMDKAIGGSRNANGSIANDKMSGDDFRALLDGSFACLFANLKPGAAIYVAHADKVGDVFRASFAGAGFHFSQMVIWDKGQHVLGMADYQPSHEPIMYGWKKGSRHRWRGGRKQRTIVSVGEGGPIQQMPDGRWCIRVGDSVLVVDGEATLEESPCSVICEPKPAASDLHPSTKPVALVERLLSNNARPGDIMVDAFSGSGSSMIAADRVGMCARVVELEPRYVDIAVRRWELYTGRRAVHAVTGESFPEGNEPRATGQPCEVEKPNDAGLF